MALRSWRAVDDPVGEREGDVDGRACRGRRRRRARNHQNVEREGEDDIDESLHNDGVESAVEVDEIVADEGTPKQNGNTTAKTPT